MTDQTAFGAFVLTSLAAALFKAIGFATLPPVGISINDLNVHVQGDFPYVLQDRTVTASAPLTARWSAQVSVLFGTKLVKICEGSGFWDYAAGRKNAEILFDEWVGQSGCWALIPQGAAFVLSAEYKWGDSGFTHEISAPIIKR